MTSSLTTRACGLLAACTAAVLGCTGAEPTTQVVTGQVTSPDAVAVRAVAGGEVISADQVRTDGSFRLALPVGDQYRLELLTASGIYHVLGASGELWFSVCKPSGPFDLGKLGPGTGGGTGGTGGYPGCDPKQGKPCPPPPPCDPAKDPTGCKGTTPPPCDPAKDPTGCKATPPPPCDPAKDPNGCKAPGCDPAKDPNGCKGPPPPPPCDPATDPNGCKPPGCDPTKDPAKDPSGCKPWVCSPPLPCPRLPPCVDPSGTGTCKDSCVTDPASCGCPSPDKACWSDPVPCAPGGTCQAGGVVPVHPPGDFGCARPAKP